MSSTICLIRQTVKIYMTKIQIGRPLSPKNSIVFDNLKNAQALFKEAVKVCHKTKKISTPLCFIGIIWTTIAILELYEQKK